MDTRVARDTKDTKDTRGTRYILCKYNISGIQQLRIELFCHSVVRKPSLTLSCPVFKWQTGVGDWKL